MGPIPLAAHVVNQQAPAAWQWHRPSEGVCLVPKLVGLARLAPKTGQEVAFPLKATDRLCPFFFLEAPQGASKKTKQKGTKKKPTDFLFFFF
jgi:hypothetical protein